MKAKVRSASAAAAALAAAAGLLLVSLLLHLAGESGPLAAAGAFLMTAFPWVAFFVPLYLLACAALLVRRAVAAADALALTLLVLPFLTAALGLKSLLEDPATAAPATRVALTVFGRLPAAVLLLALAVVELLAVARLRTAFLDSQHQRAEPRLRPVSQTPARPYARARQTVGATDSARPTFTPVELLPPEAVVAEASSEDEVERTALRLAEAANPPEQHALPPAPATPMPDPQDAPGTACATGAGSGPGGRSAPSAAHRPESADALAESRPHRGTRYSVPIESILIERARVDATAVDESTRQAGSVLMRTLAEFNIAAELTGIRKGPVITMFEILPSPGVKLSKIVNLADNIALRLAAPRVRIVAPIPGKHAVGIEVPNKERAIVSFREIVALPLFRDSHYEIPLALGKDISGEAQIVDLVQMPHLLIAGATGSGKSVCVNSIIASILYRKSPAEVKLLLVDPKIVELKLYNDIPHLLAPVITDPKKAHKALQYCIYEMERRYSLLDSIGVRDVRSFNRKVRKQRIATTPLPYIVIVVDEFADLMATTGREMESTLARLAAMSRAVGIHLVLATQRPSVDVITGLIKANIPSRIAFMVASKFDSRIIIDVVGAEKLLGQGDMLFTPAWDPVPVRLQGAYLAEEEIEALTAYVKTLGEPEYIDEEIFLDEDEEELPSSGAEDPLMDKAIEIVVTAGKASASYLQRRLAIGYNRAARLVEAMEQRGIVGPAQGSKPRPVLHVPERPR